MSAGRALGARPRAGRRSVRPRLRITPRLRLVLAAALALAALLFGGWMWLRDSSLVAVEHVTITGDGGADASAVRAALRSAALNMTTLDVQMGALRTAVSPFPEVKRLRVSTHFPHGMVIQVIEQLPVAVVQIGGRTVPVAADGTLLRDSTARALPLIPLSMPPVGRRLKGGAAPEEVALLAAAPYQMLAQISQVTTSPAHGLVAEVRNGPSLYFGDASQLPAKWIAATEVLADPGSVGASYIDVADPARPAAGTGSAAGTSATSTETSAASTETSAASTEASPSAGG